MLLVIYVVLVKKRGEREGGGILQGGVFSLRDYSHVGTFPRALTIYRWCLG